MTSVEAQLPRIPTLFNDCAAQRIRMPGRVGLKINLYHGYEVEAVAGAVRASGVAPRQIECLMVGDSYLMTHLGRNSTQLERSEWSWAMDLMANLVAECRQARDTFFEQAARPVLLADLPDGATNDITATISSARRLIDAGADAVKIEVAHDKDFDALAALAATGVCAVAHVGYAPQRTSLRRYGGTVEEAVQLFASARRARDAGASALVVELLSEAANQALCRPHRDALPVYSIFSGRADLGGQSLNVWDAVFRPKRQSKFFPPTAHLDVEADREQYRDALVPAMTRLLDMTIEGTFPPSPKCDPLPISLEPWKSEFSMMEA